MKQSNQKIELDYNALELYKIVLDIEKYPDYIPWCSKIDIIKKKKNYIKANMKVNYKFFPSQIFTSDVNFSSKKLEISTNYVKGPLKDLSTFWEFVDNGNNKSIIIFKVKFEFKNFIHQKVAEFFFPLIEKKMINSFIKRANETLD